MFPQTGSGSCTVGGVAKIIKMLCVFAKAVISPALSHAASQPLEEVLPSLVPLLLSSFPLAKSLAEAPSSELAPCFARVCVEVASRPIGSFSLLPSFITAFARDFFVAEYDDALHVMLFALTTGDAVPNLGLPDGASLGGCSPVALLVSKRCFP